MKGTWVLPLIVGAVGVSSWQLLPANKKARVDSPTRAKANSSPRDIRGTGYVEPASEVRKLMMRTGGVIRRCIVRAGDTVHQGDLILELDNSTQKAEVDVARKQLELSR